MKPASGQKGFSLLEALIVVAITGMIAAVLTKMVGGAYQNWIKNKGQIVSQREVRISRDMMSRFIRQARASTVQLDRFDANQPPLSQITFVDALGNSRAFFQRDNSYYAGVWSLSMGARVAEPESMLVTNYLQRAAFFYPNAQDMTQVNFVLYSVWPIPKTMGENIQTQMSGSVEMRNP